MILSLLKVMLEQNAAKCLNSSWFWLNGLGKVEMSNDDEFL